VLENEEWSRDTSGEIEVKQGSRKAIDTPDSILYYKVTVGS